MTGHTSEYRLTFLMQASILNAGRLSPFGVYPCCKTARINSEFTLAPKSCWETPQWNMDWCSVRNFQSWTSPCVFLIRKMHNWKVNHLLSHNSNLSKQWEKRTASALHWMWECNFLRSCPGIVSNSKNWSIDMIQSKPQRFIVFDTIRAQSGRKTF